MQCPACHDGIVGEDEESAQHAHDAGEHPWFSGCEFLVGSDGVAVRGASDDELADHDGHGKEEDETEIDEDEGCAAAFAYFCGEAPYVAQAYGGPCGSQYDSQLAAETASGCVILVHVGMFFGKYVAKIHKIPVPLQCSS